MYEVIIFLPLVTIVDKSKLKCGKDLHSLCTLSFLSKYTLGYSECHTLGKMLFKKDLELHATYCRFLMLSNCKGIVDTLGSWHIHIFFICTNI